MLPRFLTDLRLLAATAILLLWWLPIVESFAVAPAGSVIRNQASARYKDSNGVVQSTTSNVVETIVQPVASFELQTRQLLSGSAGQRISFTHSLHNTGNSTDTFQFALFNSSSGTTGIGGDIDNFDYDSMQVFADQDQNGIADNTQVLRRSAALAADEVFYFVVQAGIPASVVSADSASLRIRVRSDLSIQLGSALTKSNKDTVLVSDTPRLSLSKSISAQAGSSPSGPYRVTLEYHNTSIVTVTDLSVMDQLPTGMSYVADSGRSSVVPGAVLTDFDPSDQQSSGSLSVIWCAYDNGCTGLPVAPGSSSSSSAEQVTAIINTVPPGEIGQIWFDVEIDTGLSPSTLANTAFAQYQSASSGLSEEQSNTVNFTVEGYQGVVANGSLLSAVDGTDEPVSQTSVNEGGMVLFDNIIWNTGNQIDTFDIEVDETLSSFPAATLFTLLHSNGLTPLLDSNGNGIPDTGPLAANASFAVVLRAELPVGTTGDNGGAGFSLVKRARSSSQPTLFNPVTDHLSQITSSSVDLTNLGPLGASNATGLGIGPETAPQHEQNTTAGVSAILKFDLYVNNTSGLPDSYDLSVSADPNVPGVALPANWQVVFVDPATGGIISNSGLMNPGSSKQISAEVSVPASASPANYSLYFSARSPLTGALDIKHDGVTVLPGYSITLVPDNNGQTEAGSFVLYNHTLTNTGSSALSNIALALQDSLSASGWTSTLFTDTNLNGLFDGADQIIANVPALSPAESMLLFVRVFAPATALSGATNITEISATVNTGGTTGAATLQSLSRDFTQVNSGDISIVKLQAPDLGCDITPDSPFGLSQFDIEPGNNCVIYKLTATNTGTEESFNVIIHDSTPNFTHYLPQAVCSMLDCSLQTPAAGDTGTIRASVPNLLPGESYSLEFAVRLD